MSKYLLKIVYTISPISCKKIFLKLIIYIFKNLLNNKVNLKEFELEEKKGIIAKIIMSTTGKAHVSGIESFWSFT